jgi:hypothetical protein
MSHIAHCACGASTISVGGEPQQHNICHCTNCKRRTGSAFGISTYFLRSDVTETKGETSVYAFHHETWNHDQERHFCAQCGTTLFWYLSSRPTLIGIAGGCFAPESIGEPDWSANDAQRAAWVTPPAHWRTT